MMRRHWPSFFDYKQAYLSTGNLTALMARYGLVLKNQYPLPVTRTAQYIADFGTRGWRRAPPGLTGWSARPRCATSRSRSAPATGSAIFGRSALAAGRGEKLSIVLPVFNEARYAAQVIDAVLAKPLRIEKEVIIVESNSTDGTPRDCRRATRAGPGSAWSTRTGPRARATRCGPGSPTSPARLSSSRTPTSSTTSTTTTPCSSPCSSTRRCSSSARGRSASTTGRCAATTGPRSAASPSTSPRSSSPRPTTCSTSSTSPT